jgi:hypothetical protein
MHDPDVVAFEIKRPWRKRPKPFGPNGERLKGYRPALITVWHQDPGGYDCFDVCKRDSHWRWHFWHWHIQIIPLGTLRRWALTRCEWCGGRSTKTNPVNVSHQWDREPGPWWRGEHGLYHRDCSSVERAHNTCLCDVPDPEYGDWGKCKTCNKFHAWSKEPEDLLAERVIVAFTKPGEAMSPKVSEAVHRLWKIRYEARKARES